MTAFRTRWAAALASVAAVAVLAGCGAGAGDANAPVVRPAATRPAIAGGPFAGLTTKQVELRTDTAMRALSSMTFTMTAVQDGRTFELKLLATDRDECALTMDEDGEHWQGIVVGDTFYLKADDAFIRDHALHDLPSVIRGKWIRMSAKDNPYGVNCDTRRYGERTRAQSGGTWSIGGRTVLHGRPTITLVHRTARQTVTFWIAEDGTPYVLQTVMTGEPRGKVIYSGFDQVARISAPPADRTVDLGDLTPEHPGGGGDLSI